MCLRHDLLRQVGHRRRRRLSLARTRPRGPRLARQQQPTTTNNHRSPRPATVARLAALLAPLRCPRVAQPRERAEAPPAPRGLRRRASRTRSRPSSPPGQHRDCTTSLPSRRPHPRVLTARSSGGAPCGRAARLAGRSRRSTRARPIENPLSWWTERARPAWRPLWRPYPSDRRERGYPPQRGPPAGRGLSRCLRSRHRASVTILASARGLRGRPSVASPLSAAVDM